MTKKYTFIPIILVIILIASLIGGTCMAQNSQKQVKIVKKHSSDVTNDTTKQVKKIVIKTVINDSTETIDSLVQFDIDIDTDDDKFFKIVKIEDGDTVITTSFNDSIQPFFMGDFNPDSMAMIIKRLGGDMSMDFDFDFDFSLDTLLDDLAFLNDSLHQMVFNMEFDPLNFNDFDLDEFVNDSLIQKNIEVMIKSDGDNENDLIIITNDGKQLRIERNGEMIFINDEDVKNMESEIEVLEGSAGEKIITLQTRIILDELNKQEQSELNAKGITTSKKEPKYEYLKFYPNPSFGEFNIEFQLAEPGDVEVKIVDMLGKTVFIEKETNFSGPYNKSVDLSPLGKGNYILQIIQGNRIISRKIIVE